MTFSSQAASASRSYAAWAAYDAPELATGIITPAADVWSLGMNDTDALTQRLPERDPDTKADPALPRFMPLPFPALVQECLRVDPTQRRSLEEITIQLATLSARKPAAPEKRSPEPTPARPAAAHCARPVSRSAAGAPSRRASASPRANPRPSHRQEAPPAPQTFGRSRATANPTETPAQPRRSFPTSMTSRLRAAPASGPCWELRWFSPSPASPW